ncbi:HNH endonuclease [Pseudorhodoferax sp. Leaf265]|uniref:HNH endonuclease n=1 Tax=Pseudorhodoferax sp. Leaf265 TaxID=1736315 RepID=UPI0009E7FEC0
MRDAPVPVLGVTPARGLSSKESFVPSNIASLRLQAFQRQNGRCFYCSVSMWLQPPSELVATPSTSAGLHRLRCTAEHLIARSDGGRNIADNIVAACACCNSTRHKKKRPPSPAAYRQQVARWVLCRAWHHAWVYDLGLVHQCGIGPA